MHRDKFTGYENGNAKVSHEIAKMSPVSLNKISVTFDAVLVHFTHFSQNFRIIESVARILPVARRISFDN